MRMPVTAFAFADGTKTDSAFSRSDVDAAQAETWADRDDVADAELLGTAIVNAKNADGERDRPHAVRRRAGRVRRTRPPRRAASSPATGEDRGQPVRPGRGRRPRRRRHPRPPGHPAQGGRLHRRPADLRARRHRVPAAAHLAGGARRGAAGEEADAEAYDVASAVALRGLDGQVRPGRRRRRSGHLRTHPRGLVRLLARLHRRDDDHAAHQGVPLRHLRARRRGVLHAVDGPAHARARRDARHGRLDALPAHRRRAAGGRSC